MGWDLTEAVAPVCETVVDFHYKAKSSDGSAEYRVTFGPTPYGRYQNDWECECKGFQTRKTCRHVEEAKAHRCGWNRHLEPYSMPEDRKCPDCGGGLKFIKVGV